MPDTVAETLVGGAPVSMGILSKALTFAPRLVAADGGADRILAAGLRPARVVGDMDSLSKAAREAFRDVLDPISEQDSTDFAKAIRTSRAPLVIGVGFIGARIDHFLACLSELARRTGGPACILLGEDDCLCILPTDACLDLPVGTRVSLWPLGRVQGRSTGLQWPIDGLTLEPAGRIGTSNRTAAPRVTLCCSGAPMALILPSDCVSAMLDMMEFGPRGAQTGNV
ncbi:MAG: thiamine diphosphokinase [Jannaschia sp.]